MSALIVLISSGIPGSEVLSENWTLSSLPLNCCARGLPGSYSIVMNLTAVRRASALSVLGTIDVVICTADAGSKNPEEIDSDKKINKRTILKCTLETSYPLFIIFIYNRSPIRPTIVYCQIFTATANFRLLSIYSIGVLDHRSGRRNRFS